MLYELLYSSDDDHRLKRQWILRILAAGASAEGDYKLYQRRHVLEICMTHFASSLADGTERAIIIDVRTAVVSSRIRKLRFLTVARSSDYAQARDQPRSGVVNIAEHGVARMGCDVLL
jgi:hypothetical protein